MHRVVITGIGVVAPNGLGARAFGEAIAEGRSGVGYIESFDTTGLPIKIAGEVKGFDVTPYLGPHKKNGKLMSRAMRFAVGAAAMAVEDSGVDEAKLDPTRFGVCMGTGITPVDSGAMALNTAADRSNRRPAHSAGPQSVTVASTVRPVGPVMRTTVPQRSSRVARVGPFWS